MRTKHLFMIVSFILSLLMIFALLSGCAKPNDNANDTSANPSVSVDESTTAVETENIYDENGYLKDSIPENTNLGGETITLLYWSNRENPEFFSEKITGNSVEDAIYQRNLDVEQRLKVKLNFIGEKGAYGDDQTFLTKAQNEIKSGTHIFDIYAAYSTTTATLAYNGLCNNLLNYEALDFEKPWWPDSLTKEATINNKIFFTSGDISTNMLYMMYCCYFNKDILKANGLQDPYALVNDNQWTIDKLFEMAKTITVGTSDTIQPDTTFGFALSGAVHIDAFFVGSSLMTVERDSEGVPKISPDFNSEKAQTLVEKVCAFLNETGNYDNTPKMREDKRFEEGHALFTFNRAALGYKSLTNVDFKYGIVPIPKYNSEQENYSTVLGFPFTLYAISKDSVLADDSALVLEALCSEGYRQITPVLFEQCLKVKYADDPTTASMFDIIRNSVCFDIGRIYCKTLNRYTFSLFRDQVQKNDTAYISKFDNQKSFLEKTLEIIVSKVDSQS